MYALFLETKAAEQIDRYVAVNGGDAEEIKQKCYANAKPHGRNDDWWVNRCLNGDSHKDCSVDSLFTWRNTKEGIDYWERINDY